MDEIVKGVFAAPLATVLVMAGIAFLFVAVVGNVSGKIEPGTKGRIISGILGLAFFVTGLAMHLTQPSPPMALSPPTTQEQSLPINAAKQPTERAPAVETSAGPYGLSQQTRFEGIVADVTRFEKTGELLTLELELRNLGHETIEFCFEGRHAKLLDELTGDRWDAISDGGSVGCIRPVGYKNLAIGASHALWIKFKVENPDKKQLSLVASALKRPLEGLVLAKQ